MALWLCLLQIDSRRIQSDVMVGDKDNKWLYMPDLAFVTGVSNTVTAMHRIQQTA